MKKKWLIIALFHAVPAWCQKPPLDTSVLGKWPEITRLGITNDGRSYFYNLEDRKNGRFLLTVESDRPAAAVPLVFFSSAPLRFSEDSRWGILRNQGDSLGIVDLPAWEVQYVPDVSSFRVSGSTENAAVAYLTKGQQKMLTVRFLSGTQALIFSDVTSYQFNREGTALVFTQNSADEGEDVASLTWLDLRSRKDRVIWKGLGLSGVVFDRSGKQLAFKATVVNRKGQAVYYFAEGQEAAGVWVDGQSPGMGRGYTVGNEALQFSLDGNRLLFAVQRKDTLQQSVSKAQAAVDIWNYKDQFLQSEQMSKGYFDTESVRPTIFLASIGIHVDTIRRLDAKIDEYTSRDYFNDQILFYHVGIPSDSVQGNYRHLYAVSAVDGKRVTVTSNEITAFEHLSPGGRFVTWFDGGSLQYWCYDLKTRARHNISAMIPDPLFDTDAVKSGRRCSAFGLPAWEEDDKMLLVYDQYDIWEVDPTGHLPAVCLSKGVGRQSKIVFGLINTDEPGFRAPEDYPFVIQPGRSILLSGYSKVTKENGFWEISDLRKRGLVGKTWGPYCFYISRVGAWGEAEYPGYTNFLRKAKNSDTYLVCKMDIQEYPNWYVTKDLLSFKALTDIHPERAYNWLRDSLVTWRMTDGKYSQGILYYPENFDSTKKYPIIFTYYERRSDELHNYLPPDFTSARLDIPYFVSNGYLVFVPDIYFRPGHNGDGVSNAVLSATRFLMQFPWVDSTKMGLQGHSFGGWETNFLITQSSLFKAACEAAGPSDQISAYDGVRYLQGSSEQDYYEVLSQGSPYGVGVTPWTSPELYLENSPVFFVGRVTTPLLMMQGDADPNVRFSQSIEFYLALRRAGKKVWFLQYEKEGHTLGRSVNAMDFTLRAKQFFDYYLKGALPPRWMTRGVPAYLKGADTGLELDDKEVQP